MATARVLIVDDDADLLEAACGLLCLRNYEVISASSPRSALEIVKSGFRRIWSFPTWTCPECRVLN